MLIEIRAVDAGATSTINNVNQAVAQQQGFFRGDMLKSYGLGRALSTMGKAMTAAGAAIVGGLGASAMAAADFDHHMALAQTQAQLGARQFGKLGDIALDISEKFGIAATDIADAFYEIFSGTEQGMSKAALSVSKASKAAVAGGTDIGTTISTLIDIENAFGMSAEDATQIFNLQFQMLRKSKGTYAELVSYFGNVIGAAKTTDQSLQSVSGAIAFLTKRGRSMAQSTISVSRALDQISRSGKEIKQVLGVSVYDAQGNFRQLNDIITDMGQKMADMTSRERAKAFYDMFGAGSIQANRFFRVAVPQFKQLNKSVDDLSKKDISGQLRKAFNIMRKQDPSYQWSKFVASFKRLAIEIGNAVIPVFREILKPIRALIEWFTNLDDGTKKTIARFALFAGVILAIAGPIVAFIGTITMLSAIMGTTFLGVLGPVALVVAAVVALVAIGVYVVTHWTQVKEFFINLWNDIKTSFMDSVRYVEGLFGAFFTNIGNWIGNVGHFFASLPGVIMRALASIPGLLLKAGEAIVKGLWQGFLLGLRLIIIFWASIFGLIWKFFKNAPHWLLSAGKAILRGLWAGIKAGWNAVVAFFRNVPHWVASFFSAAAHWLLSAGRAILKGLWEGLKFVWNSIVNWFRDFPEHVKNFFSAAGSWLLSAGKAILEGLKNGLIAAWDSVRSWISDRVSDIKNFFTNPFGIFSPSRYTFWVGNMMMQGLHRGLVKGFPQVQSTMYNNMGTLRKGLTRGGGTVDWTVRARGLSAAAVPAGGGVQINVRDNARGDEIARELDWYYRTRRR